MGAVPLPKEGAGLQPVADTHDDGARVEGREQKAEVHYYAGSQAMPCFCLPTQRPHGRPVTLVYEGYRHGQQACRAYSEGSAYGHWCKIPLANNDEDADEGNTPQQGSPDD